ncbi:Protein of unknown function [Klenkia soli]|uniref:DUF2020 domain-containing protein n=1 Tax=Klenkia soli TaxID=1052260 RepID=A0A1H0R9Q4_9ACTN|nr:Protein of unknown function [Klenkia soli]
MSRRLLLPALGVLLAACSSPTPPVDPPASTTAATTTSAPAPTTTAAPTTAEPVTTEQDCPYLATAQVEDVVGQKTPTVTTTGVPGGPPPGCTFAKPDGEPALTVEITQAADPIAARTAAVERVAGIGGTAVDDIADGGGIAVGTDQTVLAVADGTLVVVVTVNQESSLQAREIAQAVVGAV